MDRAGDEGSGIIFWMRAVAEPLTTGPPKQVWGQRFGSSEESLAELEQWLEQREQLFRAVPESPNDVGGTTPSRSNGTGWTSGSITKRSRCPVLRNSRTG